MRRPGGVLVALACAAGVATVGLVKAGGYVASSSAGAATDAELSPAPGDHVALRAALPRIGGGAASDGGEGTDSTARRAVVDELLATPMLDHPEFAAEVGKWIGYWERQSDWFPSYLDRMTWFEEIVDTALASRGLPWSLRYLPVIESGYSPSAVSSARAVGMWQFMAHTAEDFGIVVDTYEDDRRDPFVSTAAAADYLLQLRGEMGSWFLALAAYNAGPDRIRGILARHAPDAEPSDALYWAVRRFLPKETADFVPNLFGAMIVASDPRRYGYESPEPQPFEFERVPVLGRVSFEVAALATGATREEIARLNPEYVQGVTPGERVVDLRVPSGTSEAFRAHFAAESESDDRR